MTDTSQDFESLLAQARGNSTLSMPEGWGQGRATFGGLVAAVLYAHMEHQIEASRLPRSLSLSFVGPVSPGPVELETEILREGRGVTQVQSRMRQNGQIQAVMLGSFGAPRTSQVQVQPDPAPAIKAPDACIKRPTIPGVTPEFMQWFDHRWGVGAFPYMGSKSREMGGWVRFAQPQTQISVAHLLALADSWPPTLLPMLKKPAPASTLCWTLEFIHPLPSLDPQDWVLYLASIDQASNGYGQTQARIWSAQGELIALSRQTVTVFD